MWRGTGQRASATTNSSLKQFYSRLQKGAKWKNQKLCFAQTQHFNFLRSLLSSPFFSVPFPKNIWAGGHSMMLYVEIFLLLQRLFLLFYLIFSFFYFGEEARFAMKRKTWNLKSELQHEEEDEEEEKSFLYAKDKVCHFKEKKRMRFIKKILLILKTLKYSFPSSALEGMRSESNYSVEMNF